MMKRLLSLAMMLCLVATTAMAQVTTSAIRGQVQSTTGEEIIGATIQAVHTPTGTNYGSVTNLSGNFTLTGLRAGGPYKVTVSYVGFRTKVFEGISLQLGQTLELDVDVAENSQQLGEVVVTADKSSVFNMNRMGSAQNFDSKAIQQTASVSRSIFDVAKTNPLAMSTGGGTSFGGANNRYNSFQIDGAVSNDVFGLAGTGTNGGQTGANPISLEAIDEVQVVIAPFDVRKSGFTGGGINAVTKSGTNEFHGSAYMYYNNENFYGKTPGKRGVDFTGSREKLGEQSTKTYGFTAGGPIIKNKLFFFANYEKSESEYPASNVIGTGSSALDTNEVDQVVNFLQTNYNTNGGGYGSIDIPTENEKFLARLDWNINDYHKLMFRYSHLEADKMKSVSSKFDEGQLLASGYMMVNKTDEFVAELNSNFGNGMNNILRGTYTRVRDHRDPNASPLSNVTIEGLSNTFDSAASAELNFGIENYSVANALDQDIFTIEDNFTWAVGDHKITVGTHNEFFEMANLFIAYAGGTYTYQSLDDFLNNDPSYYRYRYSREDITGTNRWMPEWGAGQIGFYGQDEWRVNDNLRLTYGVRVDIPLFFDDPMVNETFNNSALAREHGVATGELPSSTPLISPRVGFRWWANDDHSTLLRGGVGLFTGRIPFVWISNAYSNTGMGMADTKLSSKDAIAAARDNGFTVNYDPNNQWIDPTAAIPTAEVDVLDDDFKFPQTLRANLAVEQQLPFGVRGTVEAMYSKTYNNILYTNLNYAQDGTRNAPSGDNRPMWSKVDNNFTDVILLSNTNKGYNYNVTAKLEKNFDFGLNAMVAYTYGQSRSVNDGTSSQAYSCWKYNYNYYNDKSQEVTYSKFDVRNRIIANIAYRKEYLGHFATEVSLFYQGYNGGRYSLVEYGNVNNDGRWGNDVLYLPERNKAYSAFGTEGDDYLAWLDRNSELDGYVGSYVPRNAMRKDFEHHFDFHFAQDFFINYGGKRHTLQLNFDVLNVGNLLNPEWGMYNTPSDGYSKYAITTNRDGVYQFTDIEDLEGVENTSSRWQAQIGVKYIF